MSELSGEYLTTRELAELLRIKERKVYDLAAAGEVPCSRATGKLLFPRAAVEAWVTSKSIGFDSMPVPASGPNVFLGSHDPLLDWALRESGAGLATFFDGTRDGLDRFAKGEGIGTGLHLFEPKTACWNESTVRERFAAAPVVLVEFAWRERGWIVSADVEPNVRGLSGLKGRRVVPRQSGAGSQALLEHLLAREGFATDDIRFIDPARTETDAALAVLEGKADAALGLLGVAHDYRLSFVPVMRERFDLLVERRAWFEPPMQRFLRFCNSPAFVQKAGELRGYDINTFGQVRFNGS
jgi:excisionase family DNA binding protein